MLFSYWILRAYQAILLGSTAYAFKSTAAAVLRQWFLQLT
ncbi:hypothetical protein SynPROSU1_02309 [Synechococcus sp. PROS-U-1]|nr:hypothetical protein SynPROSU1_02309 [Synechococcus sp. PROS-U-1]